MISPVRSFGLLFFKISSLSFHFSLLHNDINEMCCLAMLKLMVVKPSLSEV